MRRVRDLYISDNLPVLRGLGTDTVDLIYLDPPFNSKKQYAAPIGTEAEGQKFNDTWRWDELDAAWLGEIDRRNPALSAVINAARLAQGDGTAAYLAMIGIRLLEMKRILKPSGSIYLHCDDTANSYLRLSMDAVWRGGFRNELTWRRATAHNASRRYGRITDSILFYASGRTMTWNPLEVTSKREDSEELARKFPSKDVRGQYRSGDLTGQGVRHGESGAPWRGFDPSRYARHWSASRTGPYAAWIERNLIPGFREMASVLERLDALDRAGLVLQPTKKRRWPGLKRYQAAYVGVLPQSLILEPQGYTNYNKGKGADAWTGWRTQKPLALLQRIVKASSNRGDLVLDPFCGCATACVAAEIEGRQWIGIDACEAAEEITRVRLADAAMDWNDDLLYVSRQAPPRVESAVQERRPTRQYRTDANIDRLYGVQRGYCPGCSNHYHFKDMHVDHVVPRSDGGGDDLRNLQLLCGHCNSTKGDGSMKDLWSRLVAKKVLSKSAADSLRKQWMKRWQEWLDEQDDPH